MQCKQRNTMNAELKKQMDERLVEGALSPEEYLAEVKGHCGWTRQADVPDKPEDPKRLKWGLKQWQWGVLIPMVLFFSVLFAESPALPKGYVATGGGQSEVAPDAKPKTLRDYYTSPVKQPDIFSMPDPRAMPRNPGQSGQPQISPEDAYALGIAMSPLVQLQQEMLAQQQNSAVQKQQAQQMKKQQDAQRALEYAQRFQNMGVPNWARPQQPQQQQSVYTYTCPQCGLTLQFNQYQFQGVRCPKDGSGMWKK